MFREMRRKQCQGSYEEAEAMMKKAPHGILGVLGDEGYPYTVPVSFVYKQGKIFLHCATEGHKLDALMNNEKVSFCVIEQDEIIPEEFNTLYRSAIAFGRAKILREDEAIQEVLEMILDKYSPKHMDSGKKYIKAEWANLKVVEIEIDHMTAKAGD